MKYLFFSLVLLLSLPTMAQEIVITKEMCREVADYVPSPDVAYTPGVDVHGNPVAPADLAGSSKTIVPDEFIIDIGVFLGDALNIPLGEAGSFTESRVDIKYNSKTHEVLLNDELLVDVADTRLPQLCAEKFSAASKKSEEEVPAKQ